MSKISHEQSQQIRSRRGSVDVAMPLEAVEEDLFRLDAPAIGEEDAAADLDKMSTLRGSKGKLKEQGFELEQQMQEPVDQAKDVMSE